MNHASDIRSASRRDFNRQSGALQPDTVAGACQFYNSLGRLKDTLFMPNTFGPRQQMGEDAGVPAYEPANLLLDDRYFANLSGQQAYKCFACRITKAPAGAGGRGK